MIIGQNKMSELKVGVMNLFFPFPVALSVDVSRVVVCVNLSSEVVLRCAITTLSLSTYQYSWQNVDLPNSTKIHDKSFVGIKSYRLYMKIYIFVVGFLFTYYS